jgi:hypothetical protein
MEFTAPVSDWEGWTGMRFEHDGSYLFAGGLAPLRVADHVGRYWEPNVWMLHDNPLPQDGSAAHAAARSASSTRAAITSATMPS